MDNQLQALVEKWREAAIWEHKDMGNVQAAAALDQCADELAALLAQRAREAPMSTYEEFIAAAPERKALVEREAAALDVSERALAAQPEPPESR